MARVMRQRERHQNNFSLKKYGSWAKAEAAAKIWIKSILPALPPEIPREVRMTKKNHSGVVEVYRSPGIVKKKNGNIYSCPRWIARWPNCPLRGGLSWSVKQFDEEGAFVLAYFGLKKKSVNRGKILEQFDSVSGTKEFNAICSLRKY